MSPSIDGKQKKYKRAFEVLMTMAGWGALISLFLQFPVTLLLWFCNFALIRSVLLKSKGAVFITPQELDDYRSGKMKALPKKSVMLTFGTHTNNMHFQDKASIAVYQKHFGEKPRYFAYPYGFGTLGTDHVLLMIRKSIFINY
ncbi:hypothetical protein [Peribacillus kribbensis]|uniref:hypothetical protein n=1 Tax=Peribacillus kribbensis TaxID=356658 RepID=UPI0003F4D5AE|nr:hypothetical protein [Peribacillus kribbensis]